MEKPVIIFGARGLAKSALEIFESNGVVVYGFLDEDEELHHTQINHIPVLGSPDDYQFLKLIGETCEAFVAHDNHLVRKKEASLLAKTRGVMPVNAVHQTAFVSASAGIGHGNFIGAGVKLITGASVGQHCIINTGAVIDFDSQLADFVQVGAGAVINANVKIANYAFIGSGAVIVGGVSIGKNVRVGAGSVVVSDVADGKTVFGNPAKLVEPHQMNPS